MNAYHDYTTDDVYSILSLLGLGYSAYLARNISADIKGKPITENVKHAELMDPKKMSTRTEKLSDMQVVRHGFEAASNMILKGGEPLVSFVVNKPLSQIQTKIKELEEYCRYASFKTKSSIIEPSQPKDDRLKLKHEVALEIKEDEMRKEMRNSLKVSSMLVSAEDHCPRFLPDQKL